MDFTRFATEYDLDRATILKARDCPDYPEPVIRPPGNYWYWEPDLDRFLVRHRDDPRFGADPSWPATAHDGIQVAAASLSPQNPPVPVGRDPGPRTAEEPVTAAHAGSVSRNKRAKIGRGHV